MIRSRPDTSAFESPPKDPTDFLAGGRANSTPAPAPVAAAEPEAHDAEAVDLERLPGALAPSTMNIPVAIPAPTKQKLFRLRFDTATRLMMAAAEESVRRGRRVTETELVEQLITRHLKVGAGQRPG
jgi:hypothetical protein